MFSCYLDKKADMTISFEKMCLDKLDEGRNLKFIITPVSGNKRSIYIFKVNDNCYQMDECVHDMTDLANLPDTVDKAHIVTVLNTIKSCNKYKMTYD
jgi:hypothetical protein